jgi:excinuclease UvrABC nuclease subunit
MKNAWQPEVTIFATDPSAALRSLQRLLKLDTAIRAMDAIDIAHLQGGETVGSKVAFIDGRPFKDGYRRYKVRSVANDDYGADQTRPRQSRAQVVAGDARRSPPLRAALSPHPATQENAGREDQSFGG